MNRRDTPAFRSYFAIQSFLAGRDSRKLCNNTYVEDCGDYIAVKLHYTHIIKFWTDGRITLHTGGYETVTTKDRLNRCQPFCYIYQKNYTWYVSVNGQDIEFYEGINVGEESQEEPEPKAVEYMANDRDRRVDLQEEVCA